MALILSIVGYKNQPTPQPRTQRFTEPEVTLGRVPQNSCVLPDPENVVSKTHCIIRRQGGAYELADCSSNGTFLNFAPEPLGRERTAVLKDGDRLAVGDYDILVQIAPEPDAAAAAPARPPAALTPFLPEPFDGPDPFGAAPAGPSAMPAASDPFGLQNLMGGLGPSPLGEDPVAPPASGIDSLFPASPFPASPFGDPGALARTPPGSELPWPPAVGAQDSAPWVTPSDHTPPEQASFRAPSVAPPAISEDWDPLAITGPVVKPPAFAPAPVPAPAPPMPPPEAVERVAARPPPLPLDDAFGIGLLQGDRVPEAAPAPAPAPRSAPAAVAPAAPAPAADDSALLRAFLDAAGLPPTAAEGETGIETMRHVGELLREMVAGLSEVLAARSMIKGEYRLDRTQIGAANNNPLKLSPTAEAALALLIGPARPGYMPGMRAVKEGFRDIKAHELALVAGMQAAVSGLLRQFDPEQLKKRLDKHSLLGSLLPATRKAKYWEVYEQQYRQIAGDVSEDVSGVFGRAFARAYEEQIEKLSS